MRLGMLTSFETAIALAIGTVVFGLLALVVYLIYTSHQFSTQCNQLGGTAIDTPSGYECVRLEKIPLKQKLGPKE